jgi:hypothetical protein
MHSLKSASQRTVSIPGITDALPTCPNPSPGQTRRRRIVQWQGNAIEAERSLALRPEGFRGSAGRVHTNHLPGLDAPAEYR